MSGLRQRRGRILAACLLWALLLIFLALEPDAAVEIFLPFRVLRDLAHAACYGVLAFLVAVFLIFKRSLFSFRFTDRRAVLLAFGAALAWGGFTEYLQKFTPDRIPEAGDVFWDAAGAAAGLVLFAFNRKIAF